MSNSIISNFDDFNFDNLSLAQPHAIQGGTYFTRLTNSNSSMYIQTPKCSTKQGITKTEHKIYTDLLFTQENNSFIEWLESLENKLQNLIYEKRTLWFHNDLELDDIENAFTSLTRSYKSGKNYLVRCNLGKNNNTGLKQEIKIFNESEKDLKLEDIAATDSVITILEISGIRFSSRSFHVDLYIKQLMVFQNESPFTSCMIRPSSSRNEISEKKEVISNNDIINVNAHVSENENEHDNENDDENDNGNDTISTLSEIDSLSDKDTETNVDELETGNDLDQPVAVSNENNVVETKQDNIMIESVSTQNKSLGDIESSSNILNNSLDEISKKQESAKDLEEVELTFDTIDDEIKLKDPNEVYMQIYMEARQKAKLAKKAAIEAYLEAKKIKNTYLLEEIDESDEEDMLSFSEN